MPENDTPDAVVSVPVGRVVGGRAEVRDDDWGRETAIVRLDAGRFGPEAVAGLDAVDGTPVLDIKPYMAEFGPQGGTTQPDWATELMREYY
ncbi:TrmO family methyltransferase domain-containing protein [Actinomadura oligospora]|uniref:TrmO family methyltransferase domain-containing protein n=1 Tax=Actinomadura oligospora TaxID=111804 RepID=UPI0004BC4BDB|nr:TrmO family methyltransferase [Actinomadura oligospora]